MRKSPWISPVTCNIKITRRNPGQGPWNRCVVKIWYRTTTQGWGTIKSNGPTVMCVGPVIDPVPCHIKITCRNSCQDSWNCCVVKTWYSTSTQCGSAIKIYCSRIMSKCSTINPISWYIDSCWGIRFQNAIWINNHDIKIWTSFRLELAIVHGQGIVYLDGIGIHIIGIIRSSIWIINNKIVKVFGCACPTSCYNLRPIPVKGNLLGTFSKSPPICPVACDWNIVTVGRNIKIRCPADCQITVNIETCLAFLCAWIWKSQMPVSNLRGYYVLIPGTIVVEGICIVIAIQLNIRVKGGPSIIPCSSVIVIEKTGGLNFSI